MRRNCSSLLLPLRGTREQIAHSLETPNCLVQRPSSSQQPPIYDRVIDRPGSQNTFFDRDVASHCHGLGSTTPQTNIPVQTFTRSFMGDTSTGESVNPLSHAYSTGTIPIGNVSEGLDHHGSLNTHPSERLLFEACNLQRTRAQGLHQECVCVKCLLQIPFLNLGFCPGREACGLDACMHLIGYRNFRCPFAGCSKIYCRCPFSDVWRHPGHLMEHSSERGRWLCTDRKCLAANRDFARQSDLIRHCEVAHCKNAPKYHCHVLDCKYHNNLSFNRKDTLQRHIKSKHAGHLVPRQRLGQGPRRLEPMPKESENSETKA